MAHQSKELDLRAAWTAIASSPEREGWRIIPLGADPCFRVGIRFPDGQETFVAGFNCPATEVTSIPQGRGFEVENIPLPEQLGFRSWISVSRRPGASLDLFTVMVTDLLDSLDRAKSTASERQRYLLFLGRIRSWQRFMEKPSDDRLTDEEEIGVFGELLVLEHLLNFHTPDIAVGLWKGPENCLQDFRSETVGLEVKSTASLNGFPIKVSSLEQLDGVGIRLIYLVGLRLALVQSGRTLPNLVNELRYTLRNSVGGAIRFERLLLLAGYQDALQDSYIRRFQLQTSRLFHVETGFPYLSRSALPSAILDAEYRVDLDEISLPCQSMNEIFSLFESEL
jgi:hypothetical protein